MDIKTIQQYVRTTTSNTNPAVLASMIRSTGQGSSKSGNIMYLELIPDKVASIPELRDIIGGGSGRSYFDVVNASYEEVKNHVLAGGAIGFKSSIADMIEEPRSELPREISGTFYGYYGAGAVEQLIFDFTATSTNDTPTLVLKISSTFFAVPSDPSILIDRPSEG